jgi:hypothetical protein
MRLTSTCSTAESLIGALVKILRPHDSLCPITGEPIAPENLAPPEFAPLYFQYRFILDKCYVSFTAYNGADMDTLTRLIDHLPGFLVQNTMLPLKAIADLYSVDLELT